MRRLPNKIVTIFPYLFVVVVFCGSSKMDLSSIVGQSVKNIFFQDGKEDKVSLRQHSQRESLPPEPSLVIRKQVI